jgi:hypothetical protein
LGVKSFFKKIGNAVGFTFPSIKITPEREQELIDKLTQNLKSSDMANWAILGLVYFQPVSAIFSYTVLLPWSPILQFMGVDNIWEYVAFLSNNKNIEILIKRLDMETRRT